MREKNWTAPKKNIESKKVLRKIFSNILFEIRSERLQALIFSSYDEYVTIFSTGSLQGRLGPKLRDIGDENWYYPKKGKFNNDFIHWTQHFHKGQINSNGLIGVFSSKKKKRMKKRKNST